MAEKGTIQRRSQNLARLVLQLSFQVNIRGNSQLSFKRNNFLVSELFKATYYGKQGNAYAEFNMIHFEGKVIFLVII